MFQNYYFSTTALTNTVKSIEAIGDNFYTRRIDCTETMEILRDKDQEAIHWICIDALGEIHAPAAEVRAS